MRFNKNLYQSAFLIVITLLFSVAIHSIVHYKDKSSNNYITIKPPVKVIDNLPEIEIRDIFERGFAALDVPKEHFKIFDILNIILSKEDLDRSSTKIVEDEFKKIQEKLDSNIKNKADRGKLTSYLELKKFKFYNTIQQYDTALYYLNIFLHENKLEFYEKEREILNFRINVEKLKNSCASKEVIEYFENRLDSLVEVQRKFLAKYASIESGIGQTLDFAYEYIPKQQIQEASEYFIDSCNKDEIGHGTSGFRLIIDELNVEETRCHINDWTALKAFYESTNGDNWTNNTGWEQVTFETPQTNCNLNDLFGIKLNEQGRVYLLDLSSNQINGSIPRELGNLTNLVKLELSYNNFSGNIPRELGNLSNLIAINLSDNQLGGSIPTEIGNLANLKELEELDLSNNYLTGEISEFRNLSNLKYLDLSSNRIRGNIPTIYGNELVSNNTFGIRVTDDLESNHNLEIVPLEVYADKGKDNLFNMVCDIYNGVDCGVDVINISAGYSGVKSEVLEEAIEYAKEKGVFIVTAAGNEDVNIDKMPYYPASYSKDYDNVISVASIDDSNQLSKFSNYGNKSVTIAAKSANIAGYSIDDTEVVLTGTSISTFFVTRELASEIASNPNRNYQQIRDDFIRKRTVDNDPTKDITITGKRLDSEFVETFNTCFASDSIEFDSLSNNAVCIATDQFKNYDDHILEYRSIGNEWKVTTQDVINTTTISGLKPCTKYEIRVRSIYGNNESAFSHPTHFTTKCEAGQTYQFAKFNGDFDNVATVSSLNNYFTDKNETGKTYALLIGINDYKNVEDLHYSVNDINLLQEILENNFSASQNKLDLTILKNKDANRENIVLTLNNIKRKAKPNDNILVYFVGHGLSKIERTVNSDIIASKLENAKTSQYILPYDFSYHEVDSDLSLDEIKEIFNDTNTLNPPFVIVDACRTIGGIENDVYAFKQNTANTETRELTCNPTYQWIKNDNAYEYSICKVELNDKNQVISEFPKTKEFGIHINRTPKVKIVDSCGCDRGLCLLNNINQEEIDSLKINTERIARIEDFGSNMENYRFFNYKLLAPFQGSSEEVSIYIIDSGLDYGDYNPNLLNLTPIYSCYPYQSSGFGLIDKGINTFYLDNHGHGTGATDIITNGLEKVKTVPLNTFDKERKDNLFKLKCAIYHGVDHQNEKPAINTSKATKPKLIVLNATSVGNQSVGLREFNNGLFTYNLVKSLKKKNGVDLNNDQYISLQESQMDIDNGVQETKDKRGDINQQSDLYFYK